MPYKQRRTLPLLFTLCSLAMAGCGSSRSTSTAFSTSAFANLSGNWVVAPAPSSKLPPATGSLSNSGNTVSGILRLSTASACIPAGTNISLGGQMDSKGKLQLVSQPVAGSVLTVNGQVAPNGRSITGVSYTVKGSACPADAGSATATQYSSISGTYAGTFTDSTGASATVSTTLTQSSAPDSNGQFHLSGNATFANNPCFTSPAVTDSLVTGSVLSASYTETNGGVTSTVTAAGTFNSDASVLTITSYSIQGGTCGGDSGTGLLTKQ